MTCRGWAAAALYVALVQAFGVLAAVDAGTGLWFALGVLLTLPAGALLLLPALYLSTLLTVLVAGPGSSPAVAVGLTLLFGVAAAVNVWILRLLAAEARGAWRRCRLRHRARPAS